GQQARQPVDPELRLLAEHDLLGRDARAADLEVDVEILVVVVALRLGCVVARELCLGDPLELESDLRLRAPLAGIRRSLRRLAAAAAACGERAHERKEQHGELDPALHAFPFRVDRDPVRAILTLSHSVWKSLCDGSHEGATRSAAPTAP